MLIIYHFIYFLQFLSSIIILIFLQAPWIHLHPFFFFFSFHLPGKTSSFNETYVYYFSGHTVNLSIIGGNQVPKMTEVTIS